MKILVTGGWGFIGCNAAYRLWEMGHDVTVWDNGYRAGSDMNAQWLSITCPEVKQAKVDIRHRDDVHRAYGPFRAIIHCAAQTAVTTSVEHPRYDFETNALGTFNLMEEARQAVMRPIVIYASTNKVYGNLSTVAVQELDTRWEYVDVALRAHGMDETASVDPISPYGCSKLAGENYVLDFGRMYGLQTTAFRQSCIYGPRQLGGTDQGWLAWFVLCALRGERISIFGDGKQVRDMLYVDDLIDAYIYALERPERVAGNVYNIGGGPANAVSIWSELQAELEAVAEMPVHVSFKDIRPGDQKIHVTDNGKITRDLGWAPSVSIAAGLEEVAAWTRENMEELSALHFREVLV